EQSFIVGAQADVSGGIPRQPGAEPQAIATAIGTDDVEPRRAARQIQRLTGDDAGKSMLPHRSAPQCDRPRTGLHTVRKLDTQAGIKTRPAFRIAGEIERVGASLGKTSMMRPAGINRDER